MTEEKVLISLKTYEHLTKQSERFEQLEICGVDNWSGWGEYDSITERDGQQEIEKAVESCKEFVYKDVSERLWLALLNEATGGRDEVETNFLFQYAEKQGWDTGI